uniref:Uncharacterized protein n=1 Tax=Lactuca sativa TaxID=4236 RepID=A0A9R1VTX0_LACSA|nr:hypothetical protein LSAT_V11C400197960 [Lactuca sativa]
MDPNQNIPSNFRNRKPDNAFALDTTHRQFPTMESPQVGFVNLLQTEEEEKLAEAWLLASQDPIEEDAQTFSYFRRNSKWHDIRLKCTEFGGIYNNLQNIRKSGSNDFDVFKAALDQFEKTTSIRKAFPYSDQETSVQLPNNQTGEHTSTSMMTRLILKTINLFFGPLEEIKRKAGSSIWGSSVIGHFEEKFDRYVHIQETKVEMLSRMERKMIDAQTSFQEMQTTLHTKTDMKILKLKANDLKGEDLEIFLAMEESV